MKKLILFSVFLLSAEIMFGQFDFGLKAGYSTSKLSTDIDTVKASFKPGFHIGVFARIGNKLYIQPEAYYTLQTSELNGDVTNWGEKVTIGSIDIPVLLGYKFIDAKVAKARLMAGPVASFVINRKIKQMEDALGPVKEGDLSNTNWAIQVGAGVDVLSLSLDVRYQFGLNDVIKEVQTQSWDSKNNVWVVSIGYKIL